MRVLCKSAFLSFGEYAITGVLEFESSRFVSESDSGPMYKMDTSSDSLVSVGRVYVRQLADFMIPKVGGGGGTCRPEESRHPQVDRVCEADELEQHSSVACS